MTHFADYFQHLHAVPTGWLDLYAEFKRARSELPKSSFQPMILQRANEPFEQSVHRSLLEIFQPISKDVAGAFGDRFQEGHWPEPLSDEAVYFLGVILMFAMRTVAHIAPTPERPLKPTIVPFPTASVSDVALWFTTEWWVATGAQLYEMEMCKQHAAERTPASE